MTIHEPATLLTDCLLAAVAGWFAWRLRRSRPAANRAARWWSHALGLTAASALVGGGYHGLAPNFPEASRAWWIFTLMLIGLLGAAMTMSLVHEFVPRTRMPRWRLAVAAKLALFAAAILVRPAFVVAIIDYGLVLLAWAIAALLVRRAWSGWMLTAIALSALAAVVQQSRWGISPRFNHNDLYHLVQALAIYGFHRAALRCGSATVLG